MATNPIFPDVKAWPGENPASNPRAVIGGNEPPLEERIAAEFREVLLSERADFLKKLDDLLGTPETEDRPATQGAVHRAKCTDDETLGLCGSLVNILRACEKHVDETHRAVKQPYLEGGRAVDGQKNILANRIITGRQIVEGLQTAYARERQRLATEARIKAEDERRKLEQLAAENNLAAALPPPPPPAARPEPIRSDDGAVVSIGTEYRIEIESWPKAVKHVLEDARVREVASAALLRIVKSTKGAKSLAGVKIIEDVKTTSR